MSAVLIMVALAGLIFGIIPIVRVILTQLGYYNQFNLYIFDLNYHFGLIFNKQKTKINTEKLVIK